MEQIQIAIKVDGEIVDLQTAEAKGLSGEPIYLDDSPESLEVIRHSTAHLMAQAIEDLYPGTKFFVGPVVEGGFYYDMRVAGEISEKDLKQIEKKKNII